MIIFFDPHRKYKFLNGYHFKIGERFYRIDGIEELRHKEATGSVASGIDTKKDFDEKMKPLDGFIYFVEHMGIDGRLGFQLEFPKGTQHGTPRGEIEYIYFDEANPLDPTYIPLIIEPGNSPTFHLYNPHTAANNSDVVFTGERWKVTKLEDREITPDIRFIEMTDYAKGGIGQG